ncbi:MAG: amidohydrolase [Gaiellaceae bacterium]
MTADLILVGCRILTLDARLPRADAVAVTGERISAVGTVPDVTALRGSRTEVLELVGRTLLPGFYDAHQHQADTGLLRGHVDARAPSIGELAERVRLAARGRPSGAWIEGFGYEEGRLAERRPPTRWELDAAAPDHPAAITRTCGHALVANSSALAAAGIDARTPDPPGGRLERDAETGEPTGVLHERAMELIRRLVPRPSDADIEAAILVEAKENLRLGITSVWEPWVEPRLVEIYRRLAREDRLPVRVTMAQAAVLPSGEPVPLPRPERTDRLSLAAVKLLQDGAIAPRTAALTAPYEGEPDNRGLLLWPQDELDRLVAEIHRRGLQVSIHAIGDAAIASALASINSALATRPRPDHRHRIEHCGLPMGSLAARVASSGVVPVLQPPFVHFHGETYARNLGAARSLRLYPVRSLLKAGAVVAGSSDSPVVPDRNPLLGMRVAMTRTTVEGTQIAADEAVSLDDALRLYTVNAAFAAREDDIKGSLSPGKLADLVVLDEDISTVAPGELDQVGVESTYLGGRRVDA